MAGLLLPQGRQSGWVHLSTISVGLDEVGSAKEQGHPFISMVHSTRCLRMVCKLVAYLENATSVIRGARSKHIGPLNEALWVPYGVEPPLLVKAGEGLASSLCLLINKNQLVILPSPPNPLPLPLSSSLSLSSLPSSTPPPPLLPVSDTTTRTVPFSSKDKTKYQGVSVCGVCVASVCGGVSVCVRVG